MTNSWHAKSKRERESSEYVETRKVWNTKLRFSVKRQYGNDLNEKSRFYLYIRVLYGSRELRESFYYTVGGPL